MSVIIRLQNLPWSANALDVRNFFKGLSIPDGGVHIVGGEMGDAFIAFSTDEDARQAMMLNGGKIKEVQITLLLSSRAEMQKVIEEARRTTVSFMQLAAPSASSVAPPVVSTKSVATPAAVSLQPQPPVISLSGFLQNLNQQKAQVLQTQSIYSEIPGLGFLSGGTGMFQPNAPAADLFSALNSRTYNAAGATNSAFAQLSEQLKKVSEAEKVTASKSSTTTTTTLSSSISTSTKKEVERSSRRSRSTSRERDRRRSSRDRSRSRSRDRGRRRSGRDRSRSRSRDRDRRSRSRSRDRRDRRRRSRSRDRRDSRSREHSRDTDSKSEKSSRSRTSRFSDRSDVKPAAVKETIPPPSTAVNPWMEPIQQNLMKLAREGSNKAASNLDSSKDSDSQNDPLVQRNPLAASYKGNVLPAVNYGTFQASKPLSNEHLSKLQELQQLRQNMKNYPSALALHYPREDKNKPISSGLYAQDSNKSLHSGYQSPANSYDDPKQNDTDPEDIPDDFQGQSVKVSNLETVTGYGELRRFFYGQAISSNGIKMINDRAGRRTGVAYVRFLRRDGKKYALSRDGMMLRRSVVKIESILDKEFEDAVDSYRPNYDDSSSSWRDVDMKEDNSKEKPESTTVKEDRSEKLPKYSALIVWNLPSMTTELDLMRIFSDYTIVEVLIIKNYRNPKQLDGYVKFHRPDDASRALESTHKHYIRNRRVYVKSCSDTEYEVAKNEYEAPEEDDDVDRRPEDMQWDQDDSIQEVPVKSNDKPDDGSTTNEKQNPANEDEKDRDVQGVSSPTDDKEESQAKMVSEPNLMACEDPPLGRPTNIDNESKPDEDLWEQDMQQPPKNRDPRNAFSQNLYQNSRNYNEPDRQQQNTFNSQQQQYPPVQPAFLQSPFSQQPQQYDSKVRQQQQYHQPSPQQNLPSNQQTLQPQSQFSQQPSTYQHPPYDPQSLPPQQYQQQPPQQNPQQRNVPKPPISSFGTDFNRDPRRRAEFQAQKTENMSGFYSDNSRDSYESNRNQYDSLPQQARFNPQAPPPSLPMNNNRYNQSNFSNNRGYNNNQRNQNNMDDINDKTTFILISNLQYNMKENQVRDYFDREGFCPKHIHVIRNRGRSTGECLVEFETPQEADDTLAKNGSVIGNRKAFIKHLSRNQILDVMQRVGPAYDDGPQNFRGGERHGNNNFGNNDYQKGPYSSTNYDNSNRGNNYGKKRDNERERLQDDTAHSNDNPDSFEEHIQDPDELSGKDDKPILDKDDCIQQRDNSDDHNDELAKQSEQDGFQEHDDHQDCVIVESQRGEHGFDNQSDIYIVENSNDKPASHDPTEVVVISPEPTERIEPPVQESTEDKHSNEDGSDQAPTPMRGHILYIGNLPFRAKNEEIVDYFKEYNITINDVNRKYLPDGRTTGDALVRFGSPEDANRAMDTHRSRRLGGRFIRMKVFEEFMQ